jgi:hypothetical protein
MSRQWNDKQKDEASKHMVALWLKCRLAKHAGIRPPAKLMVTGQRKIIFINE